MKQTNVFDYTGDQWLHSYKYSNKRYTKPIPPMETKLKHNLKIKQLQNQVKYYFGINPLKKGISC